MSLGPTTTPSTAALVATPPVLALPVRPRLRGVLHLVAFPVSVVTGGVLLLGVADSPPSAGHASSTRWPPPRCSASARSTTAAVGTPAPTPACAASTTRTSS